MINNWYKQAWKYMIRLGMGTEGDFAVKGRKSRKGNERREKMAKEQDTKRAEQVKEKKIKDIWKKSRKVKQKRER